MGEQAGQAERSAWCLLHLGLLCADSECELTVASASPASACCPLLQADIVVLATVSDSQGVLSLSLSLRANLRACLPSGQSSCMQVHVPGLPGHAHPLASARPPTHLSTHRLIMQGYRPIARSLLPNEELQEKAGYADNEDDKNYEVQWLYRQARQPVRPASRIWPGLATSLLLAALAC